MNVMILKTMSYELEKTDDPSSPPRKLPPFWVFQLCGWSVYAAGLAISSIPIWRHGQSVLFRVISLASTVLCSYPVHVLCKFLWKRRVGFFRSLLPCLMLTTILGILISAVTLWAEQIKGNVDINFSMSYVLVYMTNGTVVLMAWAGFYFGIKYYQRFETERAKRVAAALLARDAALRALRFQLQPHFLFNTLNAISTLVLDGDQACAVQLITRLADLLRNTLAAPDVHETSLAAEIQTAREYLYIEEIRFGDRLRTVFDVQTEALNAQVPRLLLQPLFENAIRHGVARTAQGGTITLRSLVSGTDLIVEVSNDGPLRIPEDDLAPDSLGIGLSNTQERLGRTYGGEATLTASNHADGGFEVRISLPFRSFHPQSDAETWSVAS